MKIALPVISDDSFSAHYGGSSHLLCFATDPVAKRILERCSLRPPSAEPCAWPEWIRAQGVDVILAGGMGPGPRQRCADLGITVVAGLPDDAPEDLVNDFLHGRLSAGENPCAGGSHDHGHDHTCACH